MRFLIGSICFSSKVELMSGVLVLNVQCIVVQMVLGFYSNVPKKRLTFKFRVYFRRSREALKV
jgi:hypothetical protein